LKNFRVISIINSHDAPNRQDFVPAFAAPPATKACKHAHYHTADRFRLGSNPGGSDIFKQSALIICLVFRTLVLGLFGNWQSWSVWRGKPFAESINFKFQVSENMFTDEKPSKVAKAVKPRNNYKNLDHMSYVVKFHFMLNFKILNITYPSCNLNLVQQSILCVAILQLPIEKGTRSRWTGEF
jgi:hypothetical protein